MLKSIKADTRYILRSRFSVIAWYINLFFILGNFLSNVITNHNQIYVSQMYESPKLLLLSDWSVYGFFYMILFPLLVVLPTHALFILDKKSGMDTYIQARTGRTRYQAAKLLSVFFSTFLLFAVPLIVEGILSLVCLDQNASGDPSNFPYYITAQEIGVWLPELYSQNHMLYALAWIILFGIVSGILAVINLSLATALRLKYGIFAMLPLYLLLGLTGRLQILTNSENSFNYINLMRMYNSVQKNYPAALLALLIAGVISIALFFISRRKP